MDQLVFLNQFFVNFSFIWKDSIPIFFACDEQNNALNFETKKILKKGGLGGQKYQKRDFYIFGYNSLTIQDSILIPSPTCREFNFEDIL